MSNSAPFTPCSSMFASVFSMGVPVKSMNDAFGKNRVTKYRSRREEY